MVRPQTAGAAISVPYPRDGCGPAPAGQPARQDAAVPPEPESHAGIESTAATKLYDDDDGDEDDDAHPARLDRRPIPLASAQLPDPGTMGANMSILLDSPELARPQGALGEDGAPSEATDDDDVIDNAPPNSRHRDGA